MKKIYADVLNKLKLYLKLVAIISPIILAILSNYSASYLTEGESDFCQDYISTQRFAKGLNPYNLIDCWKYAPPYEQEYNPHPPFSFIIFLPFLLFNLRTSAFIWGLLSTFFYFYSLYLILKILNKATLTNVALLYGINTIWFPFYLAFTNQNIIQLLLFLMTWAWYFTLKRKYYLTGFLIGFATLLRFWPFLFLIPFFIEQKNTIILSAVLTIFTGSLLTLYGGGISSYSSYFGPVQNAENIYIMHTANVSFISLLSRIFYVLGISKINAVFIAKIFGDIAFVMLTVFTFLKSKKIISKEPVFYLNLSVSLTSLYFIFPVLWDWGLLIYMLVFALMFYSMKKLSNITKNWWRMFYLSIIIFFPLRILPFLALTSTNKVSITYPIFLSINNITLFVAVCLIIFLQFKLIDKFKKA